jgi:hypothetical protein
MKKIILLLILVLCFSGCYWFVPGPIKRETNIMNLDIKTVLKEIEIIENDNTKTENEKIVEIKEKSLIVLKRLKPHIQNIDDYTHGRPSSVD